MGNFYIFRDWDLFYITHFVRILLKCQFNIKKNISCIRSDQIRSLAQSCPTLCDPMNRSTPGLPVHHQLPEFTQTHVHRVSDAIQPFHPLSSPSPPAPNPSQSIRVFSNESTLRMKWPKYWSFSFSIIPSKEIPGLISFRGIYVYKSMYICNFFIETKVKYHRHIYFLEMEKLHAKK